MGKVSSGVFESGRSDGSAARSETASSQAEAFQGRDRQLIRRSQLEVLMDMLRAVEEGANKPTQIMYRANLSWVTLQRYLQALLGRGLIHEMTLRNRKRFELTQKGSEILYSYLRAIEEFRIGLNQDSQSSL